VSHHAGLDGRARREHLEQREMFGDFDEAAYLRANPDVRGLVERGVFRSGFEHWYAVGANEHALGDRVSGFYEHDVIYDEGAYLRQNPDVADAVRTRAVRNGYQHWIRFGRQEFARGKRLGPFKAPNGVLRPFRVPTDGGDLFVARAPDDFGGATRVEFRVGSNAPLVADDVPIACSEPMDLVDACEGVVRLRLLMVTSPKELDLGVVPLGTRISVSIHSGGAAPIAYTYRDRGVQAFHFRRADDANEFMAIARVAAECSSTPLPVLDFALGRLTFGTRRIGYEMPLTFRIESAAKREDGLAVGGWVALPPEELAGFRAWRPERAEFFDLTRVWSRFSRPDIVERFPVLGSREGDQFGFRALVRFAQAFPSTPHEKILFGVTKDGSSEEWIELDAGRDVTAA
jgi:hypothetical protein